MDARRRQGLTMIEVVVVAAVVGVGASLALPAMRATQIFARRASCLNNLKMMGLAAHNYASTWDSLPMSRTAGDGHGVGHSAHTALLPFLEMTPIYNAYNFSLEPSTIENRTAVRTRIDAFLCPNNRKEIDPIAAADVPTLDGEPYPGENPFGRVHYGVNWGGGHEGYGDDFVKAKGTYRGVIVPVATAEGKEAGVTRSLKFKDITDGTSFTLMMAERRDGSGWAIGGWTGSEFDVHTSPQYDGDDRKARMCLTGSVHPAGPNVLMTDGSARTLSPKIEKDIWYALITRDGGEPIKFEDLNPRDE